MAMRAVTDPIGTPVRKDFLPFSQPDIEQAEIDEVVGTLRTGWITTGPKVRQFEADFAAYVEATHAVAVNSCTAAMHLALEAVGLQQGDEVITSPYTFAATAEVVRYFGANPVFVDICPDDFNLDPLAICQFGLKDILPGRLIIDKIAISDRIADGQDSQRSCVFRD